MKKLITCRNCHGEGCKECQFLGKVKNLDKESNKPKIRIMSNGTLLLIKGEVDKSWLSDQFDILTKAFGKCYPIADGKQIISLYQLYPYVSYAEFSAINSLI